jgi:hypothetical protein
MRMEYLLGTLLRTSRSFRSSMTDRLCSAAPEYSEEVQTADDQVDVANGNAICCPQDRCILSRNECNGVDIWEERTSDNGYPNRVDATVACGVH